MILKPLILLSVLLIAAARSATIKNEKIPVKVVYDENNKEIIDGSKNTNAIKNLSEKVQLSEEDLKIQQEKDNLLNRNSTEEHLQEELEEEVKPTGVLLNEVHEIALGGIANLKKIYVESMDSTLNEQEWTNLEKNVEDLINNEKNNIKQNGGQPAQNQNIIQNIISGFQNFTGNFIQNFQQIASATGNGTQQEEQPGFAQNFINTFNGGVQQITNTVNSLVNRGNSTILGDNQVNPQRPNIIQNAINSVQQLFGGQNQINVPGANQSDTGSLNGTQGGPSGFFQGVVSQVNQFTGGILQGNQSFINQVGSFFQGQQPSGGSPGGPSDENTQRPNIIQSIGNNIGQAFQNVITGVQGVANGSNPIVSSSQNVVNQVQQAVSNQFSSSTESVSPAAPTQ